MVAPGYVYPGKARTVAAVAQDPYPIWLNKNGERFMDEAYVYEHSRQEAAYGIISQPDSFYYCIFDEAILRRFMEDGFLVRPANRILPGAVMPNWRRQLLMGKPTDLPQSLRSVSEEYDSIEISDSWEAIAKWMDVPPATLKATIDEYNSSCDTGNDLFAKNRRFLLPLRTPPYYALKCGLRCCVTLGGLKINHHMELLDHEDKPIPGIYAVGIDAGGWLGEGTMYDVQLAGLALGFPLNSGRIAGENAVKKYVLGK
jgi:fumarate reductase flavoprotein subunit